MAVWYLDNDDEITDAVARLRGTDDDRVVFVVPPGSRIATGRLNFKLLAREAGARDLAMAVASPDEQVRAMAASAGVLARVTPDEAQAALERGDEPAEAAPEPVVATSVAAPAPGGEGSSLLTWRSQRLRVTTVVVLALVIVAGVLITTVLPTAEVRLVPRISAFGPITATITASADVTAADAEAGAIPATVLTIPLAIEDSYPASRRAIGEVLFSSDSQVFDQEIPLGTVVQTPAGKEFRTTRSVILPAEDGGASSVVAPIEAVLAGEAGEASAEAISIVPDLEGQGISVTNPEATGSGRFEGDPLITGDDYDKAAVNLRNRLSGALDAYLRDPAHAQPQLTVFIETAVPGPITLEPSSDELVGTVAEEFRLSGSVRAEVLAVDEADVDALTLARLRAALPEGMQLVDGSVEIGHDQGRVEGQRITFTGTAAASIAPLIDPDALAARIAGLPVSDAQAILEGLGTATVNVWPGFLGELPDDRERITLDVLEASATE